ncbi:MAG: cysteine-rich CWC family protein [Acidobacteria bacterium]|nr:cysteine-rich CWC family protein [Acidobacteriota bacterium]
MNDRDEENSDLKTCEACGARFRCQAAEGKCWCFDIVLTPQTLTDLKSSYRNCLCETCLRKITQKPAGPDRF